MHEEPICKWLLDIALEQAEEANAKKILRIYVVNGALSGALSVHIEFYFRFLSKGTIAEGASIFFVESPAELRCRNCNTVFSPEDISKVACPGCKERNVEIVSGRELFVESVEVE